MNRERNNWKNERIQSMTEALSFFGNQRKLEREMWVVKTFLNRQDITYEESEVREAEEPADVLFRDAYFQVKELVPKGRRRSNEYREKLEKAENAQTHDEICEQYDQDIITFSEIALLCQEYTESLLENNKYGVRELGKIDMLFYFNYPRCGEVPPEEFQRSIFDFRSVSVVSNRYSAVLYASENAPGFLRASYGMVLDHVDV